MERFMFLWDDLDDLVHAGRHLGRAFAGEIALTLDGSLGAARAGSHALLAAIGTGVASAALKIIG